MDKKLINVLQNSGKNIETYTSGDGSEVLILPYGGRILGLFAPDSEKNFYWTNPVLDNEKTAEKFFASDEWQNTGGDRTWMAPEIDVFLPKFPNLSIYFQPRQLDPGNYEVVKNHGCIELTNNFSLILTRSQQKIKLKLTKSVTDAPNPLRYERDILELSDIKYAGYSLRVALDILNGGTTESVSLWNLVQMPHGGDLLIPIYGKTEPVICFGDISKEDLIVKDSLIIYKMQAQGAQKITMRAIATTGRVGYIYQKNDEWCFIVRNFTVNPSRQYIDVPWQDPNHLGYSTQACNVNNKRGCFSELEYHVPAIGGNTGLKHSEDTSQIWAFRGPMEKIRIVAHKLLSLNI